MSERIQSLKIAQEFTIEANPDRVFRAVTEEVGAWWDHSFEEDHQGIHLETKLGGRFYEDWGGGGGAVYATVQVLRPGRYLKLRGPMGMDGAVAGVIELELVPKGEATLVKLSHSAVGEITEETRANYSKGWTVLLGTNLKDFVEKGRRPA